MYDASLLSPHPSPLPLDFMKTSGIFLTQVFFSFEHNPFFIRTLCNTLEPLAIGDTPGPLATPQGPLRHSLVLGDTPGPLVTPLAPRRHPGALGDVESLLATVFISHRPLVRDVKKP